MTIHIAVVVGPDGVRHLTAAESGSRLMELIAEYVRQNAELLLWPEDARAVMGMLVEGRSAAAVRRYFEAVGSRWEPEELHTAVTATERPVQP